MVMYTSPCRNLSRHLGLFLGGLLTVVGLNGWLWSLPGVAQVQTYCQQTPEGIAEKTKLRQAALGGDATARRAYETLVSNQALELNQCRSQAWPRREAIWLRLYPCDIKPGVLEGVMDRIVDRGYNAVYVETFYDGEVLLPQAANPTVWPAVIRAPGYAEADLLALAIQKGHQRGLKVYAWMYTMNFGYTYAQVPGRAEVLAMNGAGQTSLTVASDDDSPEALGVQRSDAVVIDPYNPVAQQDYATVLRAVLDRHPDGVLFDYIRYPRGPGAASVVTRPQDLWIYGPASRQALINRALNPKGRAVISLYLAQETLSVADLKAIDKEYPNQGEALWQGRHPLPEKPLAPAAKRLPYLLNDLWHLAVAHAMEGVIDFLTLATTITLNQGIPAGAVFFPEANQVVGQGYDSRLQPWDRFPTNIQWHPMAYGRCNDTSCIVAEVERTLALAPAGVQVMPVLAGIWQEFDNGRPPLEVQMAAIEQVAPQIDSISHFAYSWQEIRSDQVRKTCQLP